MKARCACDDAFADAKFHDRQWAYSMCLDTKMDVFKMHPQEYKDAQLYQWLLDGLYDKKDQQPMDMSERKSQRYTVNRVGMVYGAVVNLQEQVTRTTLLEDE